MRLSERALKITDEQVARFRAAEQRRLEKIQGPHTAKLREGLGSEPASTIRERIALLERAGLRKKNASAKECGALPADAALDRERILTILEQVIDGDTDSERENQHLIALIEQALPDPLLTDYIYYSDANGLPPEPTALQILERALAHPARVLAMTVVEANLVDARERAHHIAFSEPKGRRAFVTMRPPELPRPNETWAVALVGVTLPDGRRVTRDYRPKHSATGVVLGRTDLPAGEDLTTDFGCRVGEWRIGSGWAE